MVFPSSGREDALQRPDLNAGAEAAPTKTHFTFYHQNAMERRPAYLSLTLAEKHALCQKNKFELSLSHSELAGWATHHFHTVQGLKRTSVQGILKRSAEFTALQDAQCGRKHR
ncbi:hypothetical protein PC116_g16999 [Phytophthora cactorum]|uniref:ARS-binding protein 1 N-terminal domain-containing protein n=2 Tax=Phytophthora cactorum TaxID=29920 RepID=A0A329S8M5_9STRA|nr:hypothetical protein Pcac1_g22458 [Phytophthora cactorum]KAG2821325.1 hypothetical protein PC112_g11428 [Phytophthora cactorum]KAG2890418.1 hypothetical protein PC114_g17468 [Phytophthora cactorum]KAG2929190.1 hypothetical protein PC117_g14057 [Phytophthora cactorum]KAG4234862.1 hypothetical protein PC116_g16999 [Phytophthora cactorum]